jgi:hypothetical protein
MERMAKDARFPVEGNLPSLGGATGWLNSPPLTPEGLSGKVVAVDFCTYTCINWLRSLPYVRAWSERYADDGLVVIGVHTPEFSFERNVDYIRRALSEMRVEYPIAIDSDYAVWEAFANRYWPALYLIDAEGRIRHHKFGEGEYERSERVIQRLLADAGVEGVARDIVPIDGVGAEAAADWGNLRSPETYVGYGQTESFASPGGIVPEQHHVYGVPDRLGVNEWGLSGDWTVKTEYAVSNKPNGKIAFRFDARDVHLVMGPSYETGSIPFRVFIDGEAPGEAAGTDVTADGAGKLDFPRMYQLIRQRGPIAPRLFEIEFEEPRAEGFAFTFG